MKVRYDLENGKILEWGETIQEVSGCSIAEVADEDCDLIGISTINENKQIEKPILVKSAIPSDLSRDSLANGEII